MIKRLKLRGRLGTSAKMLPDASTVVLLQMGRERPAAAQEKSAAIKQWGSQTSTNRNLWQMGLLGEETLSLSLSLSLLSSC